MPQVFVKHRCSAIRRAPWSPIILGHPLSVRQVPARHNCSCACELQDFQAARDALVRTSSQRRQRAQAVNFKRVWWDRGTRSPTRTGLSIWRPVPPAGYVALGVQSGPLTNLPESDDAAFGGTTGLPQQYAAVISLRVPACLYELD